MDWLLILLGCIAGYVLLLAYIRTYKPYPRFITLYGPIIGLKTDQVGFFDYSKKFSNVLRVYGTIGVAMVIMVSVAMVVMLLLSVNLTLELKPEPTPLHKPQNIFLIPGVNEFVPSTFAVWFAFILTLVVHEFGHAILCRVESIAVKSMGVLFLIIPIGAFVEPDDDEVKKASPWPRMRMFGAGIMNNILIGLISFGLMVSLIGMAVPTQEPIVVGLYKNYSAAQADVPTPSIIRTINGEPVQTSQDVSNILNTTRPGDTVIVGFDHNGEVKDYSLNVSSWPEALGTHESGFMGVFYYNGQGIIDTVKTMFSPVGIFMLLSVPFNPTMEGQYLRILGFDVSDTEYYKVPFPGYWELIHLLFWSGFINLAAGLFNALPMIPLDGGFIFKEGTERILSRRGLARYTDHIVGLVSTGMVILMVAIFTLPYLFHL
ncbi:MAG TPA: site-2 protease family protein [Methanospirillum sp.]|uniref:site-2 protease family protein n=1 Tax=Methanospirillum sp. TaxID=45200 RepID=UPI002B685654|nr:site-2 protease family protein [Methanospirillum sp.]HOJ96421.1 site-2 protease family protein [Methanospirillum sp.]